MVGDVGAVEMLIMLLLVIAVVVGLVVYLARQKRPQQ